MEFKKVYELLKKLSSEGFYGTVQIEFRKGVPYFGQQTEKVIFYEPHPQKQTKESM